MEKMNLADCSNLCWIDETRIYGNARERVLKLLEAEARAAGLFPDEPNQVVEAAKRPPQPAVLPSPVSRREPKHSRSNKGYRHPETGETWKLVDAFLSVATQEELRQDEENRANPYSNSSAKMFNFRKKVVLAAGFEPN